MIGFNAENKLAVEIVNEWAEKSKNKDLISPKGSSRKNHRQDQSLLTLIAYKHDIVKKIPSSHALFGIIVHQDPDKIYLSPAENNQELEEFRMKWYRMFSDISTNTLINADFVWLIDLSTIDKFPKKYLDKLTIFVSFSKQDSSANKNLLSDLNKNVSLFFVTNNEDRDYLQSLGINKILISSSISSFRVNNSSISILAISFISGSSSVDKISFYDSIFSKTSLYSLYTLTIGSKSLYCLLKSANFF